MTSPAPDPTERERKRARAVKLARVALHYAVARDVPQANRVLQRLVDEYGGSGVVLGLQLWVDTYADHATDGHRDRFRPGQVGVIRADTGQMLDPRTDAEMPDKIAWVSAVIEARSRMDHDWFKDLICEHLPPEHAGEWVGAVLQVVADTISGLPRGHAVMGRINRDD